MTDALAEQLMSKRTDIVSDLEMYIGWAAPGVATSAPKWRIKHITVSSDLLDSAEYWADGNTAFDNVWDDRASLNYL